ncbi:Rv3235 family protein [Calidifontibacter terrae]
MSAIPAVEPAPILLPPIATRPSHLRLVGQSALAVDFRCRTEDPEFGPQGTPTAALPDPAQWSHRMLLGFLEVWSGLRPPNQIEACFGLEMRERIRRAHATAARRGASRAHPSRVLRIRVCEPADGVAEVSAVVQDRGRVHAIAMRLNGCDGRWRVTLLEMA